MDSGRVGHLLPLPLLMLLLLLATFTVPRCRATEFFSSVDSLEELGYIEIELMDNFREYLEMRRGELENYRRFIDGIRREHDLAAGDAEDYLGNPINAFTLIKRMVIDWSHLRATLNQSNAHKDFMNKLTKLTQEVSLPNQRELLGAVKGFGRLMKIYNLSAEELAKGELLGVHYGSELNWHDCFEIATTLYDDNDIPLAIQWFQVTIDKLEGEVEADQDPEDEYDGLTQDEIKHEVMVKESVRQKFLIDSLEYLALAHYALGNSGEAVKYLDEILTIDPEHNVKDTKTYVLNVPTEKTAGNIYPIHNFKWFANYSRLCRGEQGPERWHHQLKCKLDTKNRPYFVLAPLRIEELSFDPEVNLYHGLLQDSQIQAIQAEAPAIAMERSGVKKGSGSEVTDVRVSQQTWLDYRSPVMSMIRRLVSEITGLDMANSETMQVANYGIGGQYDPHNDFFADGLQTSWDGDRISTQMFYFSDVELGGNTVFPYLNIFLRPVKGAMVMWYNLHKSVDPDYRLLHAGCPVLKGSKRIGNVWIHSGRQEFRRPCALLSDTYKSSFYK